ncbi:hypothetical protein [Microvirga terricola]|uniref:Uncharacterized protein n=1 Tax=Microvirga terricola TaxID=2719797 RepID=A0ABX0VEF8_9HYPH|nr:hypothetical protein [Microvirga terricola]NIX78220.1 hypothetical protein [Microvirga terricola]
MSRWFRFYDAVLDDLKIQKLSPHIFKAWVNSGRFGQLPCLRVVASPDQV